MIRLCGAVLAALIVTDGSMAAERIVPQFHGGPQHHGVFNGVGPSGYFVVKWRFQLGHMVVASPVVADRVLYVGAKNGAFVALDAATGTVRWRFQADAAITATAAVGGGAVFFQSESNTVFALSLADGHEMWRRATGPDLPYLGVARMPSVQDWDYWSSSPLLDRGRIYIGSGDGKIYALDAKTGEVAWTFATESRVRATPATDGRTIYVGGFDGRMYALDRADGRLRWSFQVPGNDYFPQGSIQSSPTLADGMVFFGARNYHLYALNARTGRQLWTQAIANSWVPSTPAVHDGKVFVGSADGRAVFCFDMKTGTQVWKGDAARELIFSSPVIAAGKVYVGTMGGSVFAFDEAKGEMTGAMVSEDRILSSPWIENGMLYVGDNDGYIYALTSGPKFP